MFYQQLEKNRERLNQTEEKILAFLIDKKETIRNLTVREIATTFYTVPNTIVRMCQKLGFNGYTQFRDEFLKTFDEEQAFAELSVLDKQLFVTRQLISEEQLLELVSMIQKADKIHLYADGLSRFPVAEFQERLTYFGKNTQTFVDHQFMLHSAKQLSSQDLVIAVSISGTKDTVIYEATKSARNAGAKTVSITGTARNELTSLTDMQLQAYSKETKADGLDMSDQLSFHYLFSRLMKLYLEKEQIR